MILQYYPVLLVVAALAGADVGSHLCTSVCVCVYFRLLGAGSSEDFSRIFRIKVDIERQPENSLLRLLASVVREQRNISLFHGMKTRL